MPGPFKFSARSKAALSGADPLLQTLFSEVIKEFDCVITEGRRNRADQEKAFSTGNSRAHFSDSPHNYTPAIAVDVYPYPIDWSRKDYKNASAFKAQAEVVMRIAKRLHIPLVWGGDWDGDGNSKTNQTLVDMPHFELRPWRTYAGRAKLYKGK